MRKIAHTSAVKIEATAGIEMNMSKLGKTPAQYTFTRLIDRWYRWEQMGCALVHAPKQNNIAQKGSEKL